MKPPWRRGGSTPTLNMSSKSEEETQGSDMLPNDNNLYQLTALHIKTKTATCDVAEKQLSRNLMEQDPQEGGLRDLFEATLENDSFMRYCT